VGSLTSFRDLRFDPRIGESGALVETPIVEYFGLRKGVLNTTRTVPVQSHPTIVVVLAAGPSAADIELNVTLPEAGVVSVGVGCGSGFTVAPGTGCGLYVNLSTPMAATCDAARMVTMTITDRSGGRSVPPTSFPW
jgi:hypothetical protein